MGAGFTTTTKLPSLQNAAGSRYSPGGTRPQCDAVRLGEAEVVGTDNRGVGTHGAHGREVQLDARGRNGGRRRNGGEDQSRAHSYREEP